MYIKKTTPGATTLILRELDGDRLESPITVEFSEEGIARVKRGVGEALLDRPERFSLELYKDESESEQEPANADEPNESDEQEQER